MQDREMIENIFKNAIKVKNEVSDFCDKMVKKLDTRQVIENHKATIGKTFEVAVPIYKNTPGEVFADESRELKLPARAMDREAHYELGSKVRVVHAGPAMLFVEDAKD